ncbi:alpha/beta hydrolase family protein [Chitinophaga pinensis]|uniref:Prolyl oligopeptidase family serine peptidase n=1 Tax=Chitinophaga pinensis TaxID=79329 RepID=A0A5C6LNF7_9BACT|nr:prolyl oligopeptidase family serine peptidase [Chitinophaga pinensis]TWV96183.1 prolyl oligopeptidase family serine peptidase [Chitinophaga pinensis]
MSDGLNVYIKPKPCEGGLNIAWYVSNGYLVFTPDIVYNQHEQGKSPVTAVVSAARYLSKLHFVDSSKMGLQGFSIGGYETNLLVTKTNLFAAAASSAGCTNLVSAYGNLDGTDMRNGLEVSWGIFGIGASLWDSTKVYIENSPLFGLSDVKTPLLIMHNKNDGAVPFSQSLELFLGLRRLGKKVWMLQYDDGHHGLFGESALDFDIRLQQFYAYYLKGSLPPNWMVSGIPARNKGIDRGLLLDSSGVMP